MKKLVLLFIILSLLVGIVPITYAQSGDACDPNADYDALTRAAFDANDPEEALRLSLCWLEIAPDENYALQSTANAYRWLEQYEEALPYYTRALELYPDDIYALSDRADSYFMLSEYELCLADAQRAVEIDGTYSYPRETLIACAYWWGDDELAITNAEELVAQGNQSAFSEMYHAGALYYVADYKRALEVVDGAIAMDDTYPFAFMTRARILSELARDEEALDAINTALELNPEYALGYAVRADVYKWLGEYELSLADIEKSLELNPDNLFALESRVLTEYHFDNYGAAIDAGEYVLSIDPENTFILDELAESYRFVGMCDEAIGYAEQGLAVDPEWWFMTRVKGNCQVAVGDSQAGIDTIMEIAQEDVDHIPFNYNTMLRGYYQLGDYASAVQMGKVSTDDTADASYSWRLYGMALLANGDIEGASEAFAQYRALETDPDYQVFPILYQYYIASLTGEGDIDALSTELDNTVVLLNGEGEPAPESAIIEMDLNGIWFYTLDGVEAGASFTITATDADEAYYVDPMVVMLDSEGYIVALGDFGQSFSDVILEFTAEAGGDYAIGIVTDGYSYGTVEFTITQN